MKGWTVIEVWYIKIMNPCLLFCFTLQVTDLTMIYCLPFLASYHNSVVLRKCFIFIACTVVMITGMHSALWLFSLLLFILTVPFALVFSISRSPAQHNVFRCGNKPQFLSPLSYLSHLHVPGLSDISDVKRNLSELSVTSSVDSGFKGSGHSFRLRDRSPVRCKCNP